MTVTVCVMLFTWHDLTIQNVHIHYDTLFTVAMVFSTTDSVQALCIVKLCLYNT